MFWNAYEIELIHQVPLHYWMESIRHALVSSCVALSILGGSELLCALNVFFTRCLTADYFTLHITILFINKECYSIHFNKTICKCSYYNSAVQTPGFSPPAPAKKTPAPAENMWKLKFNRILTFQSGHTTFVSWYFTHAHFVQCMIDGIYSFTGGEQTPAPAPAK